MRFTIEIELNEICFNLDYRPSFLSLIKESLLITNEGKFLFKNYYDVNKDNIMKPFTFSVNVPNGYVKDNKLKSNLNTFFFHFSTNNFELLNCIFKGLNIINNKYKLFGNVINLKNINFNFDLRNDKINDEYFIFNTLSPIVVRDKDNLKYKTLKYTNSNYFNSLFYQSAYQYKHLTGNEVNINDIHIELIKPTHMVVYHFGSFIDATNSIFKIKAPLHFLNFIYQCGLGSRRSQGFGMLEIID